MLLRFGVFADQCAPCVGRHVQRDAASRHLADLVNDSTRESRQAMHGRSRNAPSFRAMRSRGVRYLLVHMDYYGDGVEMKDNLSRYAAYLRPLHANDPVWLYDITDWPPPR